MLAICVVQPADLVKTRMQLLGPKAKEETLYTVAKEIIRCEGMRGFYTGLSAALFRQATYTTARIGSFNVLTDYYTGSFGTPSFGGKLTLGMTAGAIGAVVGNPAEVALIRMTADGRLPASQRRNYKHIFNALGRITREEGVLTLWRGVAATVTRAMVVNAAQLGTYTQAREMLLPSLGDGMFLHFCSSMISGAVTTWASLPVDIVKTRVQNSTHGVSQIQVFLSIIRNEGPLALWSGFLPTFGKLGPHTVFTFIFMEQLIALMVATLVTHPLDLLKIRRQISSRRCGTFKIARQIYKSEGLKTFYCGLTAGLMRQATNIATRTYNEVPSSHTKMLIGIISSMAGGLVGCPSEMVLVRRMAEGCHFSTPSGRCKCDGVAKGTLDSLQSFGKKGLSG
ncbi:mitochondrial 2-oxoglutarate/malate carrier protein-like [Amyelois transitella]|uniref:mitochondrial 2-oxoglutarate/malate carrier protein-like n=1 Tax=Amyelois transitella TaxID=680683 RepID=UPI0029904F74|nr:mitochondrial 2-oxoglutarate/malate carrier protein-like [Amyelois transitella]